MSDYIPHQLHYTSISITFCIKLHRVLHQIYILRSNKSSYAEMPLRRNEKSGKVGRISPGFHVRDYYILTVPK